MQPPLKISQYSSCTDECCCFGRSTKLIHEGSVLKTIIVKAETKNSEPRNTNLKPQTPKNCPHTWCLLEVQGLKFSVSPRIKIRTYTKTPLTLTAYATDPAVPISDVCSPPLGIRDLCRVLGSLPLQPHPVILPAHVIHAQAVLPPRRGDISMTHRQGWPFMLLPSPLSPLGCVGLSVE